jgi:D-inositol-3-phosphate glycosyltransferase
MTRPTRAVELYGAEPERVVTVPPGVDLDLFRPGSKAAARARFGLSADAQVLLFVGRIQPLKAPDVLLRAAATMLAADPSLRRRLVVVVVGGPSGSGLAQPEALQRLASALGIADVVRFQPPVPREELADWYRAADLTVVPSYNESFGWWRWSRRHVALRRGVRRRGPDHCGGCRHLGRAGRGPRCRRLRPGAGRPAGRPPPA